MGCNTTPSTVISPALVTSTTRPTGRDLYAGLRIYELDTSRELLYDGTGWVIMSEPTVTTYVPTVTSASGTITTVGGRTSEYKRSDGWIDYSVTVGITTNGTAAGGLLITTPVTLVGSNNYIGTGRDVGSSSKILSVTNGGTYLFVALYDGAHPTVSGSLLGLSIRARMNSRYS